MRQLLRVPLHYTQITPHRVPLEKQKYVPRFRRDPNAVPSARLYHTRQIAAALPGQTGHTFIRGFAEEGRMPSIPQDVAETREPMVDPTEDRRDMPHPLSDDFCRIMVFDKAHLSPPKELWTRHNIDQLDRITGRPIPVFQESIRGKFEFLGWYRILRWQLRRGGIVGDPSRERRPAPELMNFILRRQQSQVEKPKEYWADVTRSDWARVELEKVHDSTLGNPMSRVGTKQTSGKVRPV